jgi:hypothetical protein
MKVDVTPSVRQRAVELFSPAEAGLVCAELADADLPLIANNGESVHFSILHLSHGDLAQFRTHLQVAQTDWRDVLVAARGY